MMKKIKKIMLIVFGCMLFLASVSGCNKPVPEVEPLPTEKTTEIDLIKNGESEYKIVQSQTPTYYDNYAVQELRKYINKATGITLPVISDENLTLSEDSQYLIVGNTSLNASAGISVDKSELGTRGFVIKRANKSVFMLGEDTIGTLFSAYEFLHHQFGFEPYSHDEIAIEQNVLNKKLVDFDLTEKPDVEYTQGMGGYFYENRRIEGYLLRLMRKEEIFVSTGGQPWHNTFDMTKVCELRI